METHERFSRSSRVERTSPRSSVLFASIEASKETRTGCGTVARKRARRYLAKRRVPMALWPIIAAVIFIIIAFDRQIKPVLSRDISYNRLAGWKARSEDDRRDEADHALPSETSAALNGEAALRNRPPIDFQAKHTAQIVAFLIRNRGTVDNDVVREKWKHLDRASMPLAVYLRNVEANDECSALEREISRCPLPSKSASGPDIPSSMRHRRIQELMPEWIRRGEVLLTWPDADEPAPTETSEHRPDDDDTPSTPTRR